MNAQLAPVTTGQILLDVPAEEYQRRELGVASSGVLGKMRKWTPAHVKAWAESKDEGDTPAKVFGKAYHCRVFEPEVFAATYANPPVDPPRDLRHLRNAAKPSDATMESIAWWDAYAAENAGKIILTQDQFELIEEMLAGLKANPLVNKLLFVEEGDNEVTLRWVDPDTGVTCKARIDKWLRKLRMMLDLKSTDDAELSAFMRSVDKFGYHIQHCHYSAGAAACGEPLDEFLIVAQEKVAPYLARVFRIDADAEARGFELRERALQVLKRCTETNTWPGYTGISEISLPAWALKD